jgi:plastocyanin
LGISVDVQPSQTGSVTINAPAGTYQFYCNVPGHKQAGMVGTLTVGAGGATPAATGGATETITLVDIKFDPSTLTIPANTDVTVSLPNNGVSLHNFSIDELNISVDVQPGQTGSVTINAPAGTYQFYCNVPGHKEAGMVGTLTVQ